MFRSAAAITALLILPSLAPSQEVSTTQEGTHVVVRGNTLWDLADHYLGNPFLWPLIYEANTDRIRDPHWIYPGQIFIIPGLEGARGEGVAPGQARIREVEVVSPGIQPGARMAAEEALPYAAPCPGRGYRTVFWEEWEGDEEERGCVLPIPAPEDRTTFYVDPETAVLAGPSTRPADVLYAVPRGLVYSTPWLEGWEEVVAGVGTVARFSAVDMDVTPRDRAHSFERLQIELDDGVQLQQYELLQSFEIVRSTEGLGQVVRPTGILVVTAVEESGVVATVSAEFGRVRLGQRLRRAPSYDLSPGITAEEVESDLYATLVGFNEDRAVYGIGSVAFLDVGEPEGIQPGDEFSAYVNQDGGWTGEEGARLQVVVVNGTVSSARVVKVTDPVLEAGSRLHLVKKMQ